MHIVTIVIAPVAMPFIFKTEDAAKLAYATSPDEAGIVKITDDYGQTGAFYERTISCRLIEDCALSQRGAIERSLHQQRTQTAFQRAAESDPIIRGGMRGPAVLSPVPGFNGGQH
jgi:hypothetical protein